MIEVKINGVVKWQVNEYTFVDPQMGLRSISLTVTHPSDNATVPSFVGAYVEYDGERYDIVNSKPTAEKGIDSINYKYNLIFNGQEAELQKRKIRNLATVGVDTFISQGTSFSLYADINQFKQLLENNLKYYFGNKWTINLGNTTSESVMVSVNNMFIWDLLLKTFEYYGLRWNITGNTINIGYTPDVIQHVFDYGYSGGLVKITRTAQSEPTINRLVGVGGSRNVPINYFTNRYSDFPVDPNPISGDVNIKNIMPKVFRDSVIAGTLPYIDYVEDAALVAADGVKEDALEPNEEIYPSIAGVEAAGLGRIDQIIAASVPTANTPDDAGYSPTFDIWVKDIGFDLADNQYTTTQDAKISFTSGMLAGYEFVILATNGVRNVVVDTSKSYGGVSSKYKITLINSSEDFTATGRMLPNSVIKAMAGDSFVIYDIILPQNYVELAELRVQNWLNEQLLVKKVEKPTYAIEPTDTFFEENIAPESDGKTIREKLKSGNKLTVNNTKVTDGAQELHINNITIQYGGLLPKYSFVVTDKVQVGGSAIGRIERSIDDLYFSSKNESSKLSDDLKKLGSELNNRQIGGDNLLRNAGFVGDFASIELDSQQTIEASTELFNNRLAYWEQTGTLTIVDESLAKYGKAIVINGSISQAVQSISNDKYKFRVKGKGNVSVSFSGNTKTIDLGDTYTERELDFKGDGLLSQFIISSENATIFNPKLERGTVATDMSLHHLDENPAFERLLSYQYILDAIGNGSTSALGGLILSSIMMLGKYKDGVMEKVNAGISGIYNNDNDPAVWAGGTMEMAIRTVQKFISNPNYQPTEAEWTEMAKIVFTHGGDGFFRGYIYALGGFFRGRIESNVSGNRIIVNPENRSIEMINSQNRLSGQIFFSEGSGWGAVQFYDYHANGTLKTVAALDLVNGVYFSEYADGNPVPVKITYSKNGQIQNGGIPSMTDAQADTLLVSGEWYRDGRTLKIKP